MELSAFCLERVLLFGVGAQEAPCQSKLQTSTRVSFREAASVKRMIEYKQNTYKKYYPLLHEFLMPDTLRVPQGSRSDVEEYLQSRPQDLSGPIGPQALQLPWYM
jgi:hypothetical protein